MDYRDLLFPKEYNAYSSNKEDANIDAAVNRYLNNANMKEPVFTGFKVQPSEANFIGSMLNNWEPAMKKREEMAATPVEEKTVEPDVKQTRSSGLEDPFNGPIGTYVSTPVPDSGFFNNEPEAWKHKNRISQAEYELQQAKELDAQSGSEGYEAKPDGVFSRLKNYGAALNRWSQGSSDLLKGMAQSPWSNFVDPTTVLGGQRTMVNDIDAYFNNRGIQAVKNDMLAQQKLNTELAKTKMGQFQDYLNRTPEEQAMYRGFAGYDKKTGAQGGYKSLAAAVMDLPRAASEYYGHDASPEEQESYWGMEHPNIPLKDAVSKLLKTGVGTGTPTNIKAYTIDEGKRRYAANPELYPNGETQAMNEVWGELPPEMRRTTYQPTSQPEKLETDRLLKGQELDIKAFDETAKEIKGNAKNAAINAELGRSMHKVLDRAAENGITVTGGGDLGKALRRFGANYGLVDSTTGEIISNAEVISNAIFGNQIADIIEAQNRGNITEKERDLFARQAIDLGTSEEATRLRLDLYILYNELALQASKKLNSLSNIADPIARKQEFEKWQTTQYDKTAKLVRAIVDSHMGNGYFDSKEAAYQNGGI